MLNQDRYKTAEELVKAFLAKREMSSIATIIANEFAHWLTLEADEKPEPCPFCGGKVVKESGKLKCTIPLCGYSILLDRDPNITIAAHNLVCRAVRAYKESEVNNGER